MAMAFMKDSSPGAATLKSERSRCIFRVTLAGPLIMGWGAASGSLPVRTLIALSRLLPLLRQPGTPIYGVEWVWPVGIPAAWTAQPLRLSKQQWVHTGLSWPWEW